MNRYPWLDAYLAQKRGAVKAYKPEWGWMRYLIGGKQFAAICCPGEEHGVHAGHEMVILKCEPLLAEHFRTVYEAVVPGFYSDKRHWNSVYLDGDIPEDILRGMCDMSYRLVFEKLTKRVRETIGNGK